MRIEKVIGIEVDKPCDQSLEGVIRSCFDLSPRAAKEFRQLMRAQCDPSHNAPTTTSAAFDGPEQIRVPAGINDSHGAVGSHDFSFQKTCCRRTETFRETTK